MLRVLPRLILLALVGLILAAGGRAFEQPQYVCVNKMYGCAGTPNCWNENIATSITQASFDAVLAAVNGTRGGAQRRLCVGYQFDVLDGYPLSGKLASLQAMLSLAVANDIPILVSVDPFEFWSGASDLWNWFQPDAPGYDPANVANVEWTTWNATSGATAIAWCDWGSQFRKPPHPNLASPAFRARAASAVRPLAAALAAWYTQTLLPAGKGYLLAGVKCSWEAWVGTNFYFYAGGNAYVNQTNSSNDPSEGLVAAVQVGFNAICTMNGALPPCISGVGEATLSVEQVDSILNDYLEFAAATIADEGIPRSKLMTHAGTFFGAPPKNAVSFNSPIASVTTRAKPGWSLYANAYNPSTAIGLADAIGTIGLAPWSATEWLYMGGNSGTPLQQWLAAFNNTLNFMNNRLVDVYNFEGLDAVALAALQLILSASPSCLVDSIAGAAAVQINATAWALTWTPPVAAEALYFQASSLADTLPSGALAVLDVASTTLPGDAAGVTLALPANFSGSAVYWTVVAGGCGATQVAVAPVEAIVG